MGYFSSTYNMEPTGRDEWSRERFGMQPTSVEDIEECAPPVDEVIYHSRDEFPASIIQRRVVVRGDGRYYVQEQAVCDSDWITVAIADNVNEAFRMFDA